MGVAIDEPWDHPVTRQFKPPRIARIRVTRFEDRLDPAVDHENPSVVDPDAFGDVEQMRGGDEDALGGHAHGATRKNAFKTSGRAIASQCCIHA